MSARSASHPQASDLTLTSAGYSSTTWYCVCCASTIHKLIKIENEISKTKIEVQAAHKLIKIENEISNFEGEDRKVRRTSDSTSICRTVRCYFWYLVHVRIRSRTESLPTNKVCGAQARPRRGAGGAHLSPPHICPSLTHRALPLARSGVDGDPSHCLGPAALWYKAAAAAAAACCACWCWCCGEVCCVGI